MRAIVCQAKAMKYFLQQQGLEEEKNRHKLCVGNCCHATVMCQMMLQ